MGEQRALADLLRQLNELACAERALRRVRAVCDRHEKYPIDDELSGYVPIDEIRACFDPGVIP